MVQIVCEWCRGLEVVLWLLTLRTWMQADKLLTAAHQARCEISAGTFRPQQGVSAARRGTRRLFAVLPHFGFTTRYMPVDTTVLKTLVGAMWPKRSTRPGWLRRLLATKGPRVWWNRIFRLRRLRGTQVPDIPTVNGAKQKPKKQRPKKQQPKKRRPKKRRLVNPRSMTPRRTQRQFGWFMMTDGVACSFKCERPKRAAAPVYTPVSVPMNKNTIVMAIDPGTRDVITVVRQSQGRVSGGDGQMGWPGGR